MLAVDRLMAADDKASSKKPDSSCLSHAFVLGRPPGHHAGSKG